MEYLQEWSFCFRGFLQKWSIPSVVPTVHIKKCGKMESVPDRQNQDYPYSDCRWSRICTQASCKWLDNVHTLCSRTMNFVTTCLPFHVIHNCQNTLPIFSCKTITTNCSIVHTVVVNWNHPAKLLRSFHPNRFCTQILLNVCTLVIRYM